MRHNLNIKIVQIGKLIYTEFLGSKMAAPLKSAALFGRTPRTCLRPALGPRTPDERRSHDSDPTLWLGHALLVRAVSGLLSLEEVYRFLPCACKTATNVILECCGPEYLKIVFSCVALPFQLNLPTLSAPEQAVSLPSGSHGLLQWAPHRRILTPSKPAFVQGA